MTSDVPYHPLPIDQTNVRYLHGPDSSHQDGVPAGTVTELEWDDSPTYPGTTHRCWVHVPARYDATEPASLMVFLDGDSLVTPTRRCGPPSCWTTSCTAATCPSPSRCSPKPSAGVYAGVAKAHAVPA